MSHTTASRLYRAALMVVFFSVQFGATAAQDPGIKIDLPADGHVRIENQHGDIRTEVWNESYVLVSATSDESVSFKRSPVVIQYKNKVLMISIVRTPVDPIATILLTVKVPASAQVEIVTGKGAIVLTGIPASTSARSVSGNIRANLPQPVNADINARSVTGSVSSELDAPLTQDGHVLRTRTGTGDRVLRLTSESGQINLSVAPASVTATTDESAAKPSLVGSTLPTAGGAGIPASTSQTEEVSEGDVIRVDSQLVTLNMSVVDRNTNRGLFGLNQEDFKLFEDGAEQRILQFDSASAPFDLVLLIDLSGSTRDVVKLIRQAALRFVNAARPSDRIAIITFAGRPAVVSRLTLDRERLG